MEFALQYGCLPVTVEELSASAESLSILDLSLEVTQQISYLIRNKSSGVPISLRDQAILGFCKVLSKKCENKLIAESRAAMAGFTGKGSSTRDANAIGGSTKWSMGNTQNLANSAAMESAIILSQPKRGSVNAPRDSVPDIDIDKMILKPDSMLSLQDCIGMDKVKTDIISGIVLPLLPSAGIPNELLWKGLLLFGPSGVGKTRILRSLNNDLRKLFGLNLTFITVTMADVLGNYHGDTERRFSAIFEEASNRFPAVIVIDEVDALCADRSGANEKETDRKAKNHLLSLMDGLAQKNPVMVVGTTNKPDQIDGAFLRRFEKRIYVTLPGRKERAETFRGMMSLIQDPKVGRIDFDRLAAKSERYSPADIASVVKRAAQNVRCQSAANRVVAAIASGKTVDGKNVFSSLDMRKITQQDLEDALKFVSPTNSESDEKKLSAWAEKFASHTDKIAYDDIPNQSFALGCFDCLTTFL